MGTINTQDLQQAIAAWQKPPFDEATQREVATLVEQKAHDELHDRFYTRLDFGTGGLRGIMGAGTNRMNRYTLAAVTQGLADYLRDTVDGAQEAGVVIGYDPRHNSQVFAETTAAIFATAGFRTHIFPHLSPVPIMAASIRLLGCASGVMITASHNPPKYNGYKVFWSDSCQVVSPHDVGIIARVNAIQPGSVRLPDYGQLVEAGKIHIVADSVIEEYYRLVLACQQYPAALESERKNITIVYSPLHGAGNIPVRHVLKAAGFSQVSVVASQEKPDGSFPTVVKPNPEEEAAMRLAVEQAQASQAEIVMATDPDSDRVGLAVRDSKNEFILLDGNQTGAILAHHVLENIQARDSAKTPAVITTVVSSDLVKKMALAKGAAWFNTLTGFKNIGTVMRRIADEMPSHEFVFGYEESFGYLFSDYIRDKDAVVACLIAAEAAAHAKSQGRGLWQVLLDIWRRYDVFHEKLFSFEQVGVAGAARIERIMTLFRSDSARTLFASLGGKTLLDIRERTLRDLASGEVQAVLEYPVSNVLVISLPGDGKIAMRPSGTEPKIKFYISLSRPCSAEADDSAVEAIYHELGNQIDKLFAQLRQVMEEA